MSARTDEALMERLAETPRAKAAAYLATQSADVQAQHAAAWNRCHAAVHDVAASRKGVKVYEVHHAIEHARSLYLADLAAGKPADAIERHIFDAFGLAPPAVRLDR